MTTQAAELVADTIIAVDLDYEAISGGNSHAHGLLQWHGSEVGINHSSPDPLIMSR